MLIKRGCVYFFRHVGLSPVKIGYSENESPINRFNTFKTYAPYGSEILGFIIISDAKEIESFLHKKYSTKRLSGEWFEITEEEVKEEITFYTNISDIKERNEFQIAWAKEISNKNNEVDLDLQKVKKVKYKTKEQIFIDKYVLNNKMNISYEADFFGVSRRCIYDWIKKYKNAKT